MAVYIRGMGLCCALGSDLPRSSRALEDGVVNSRDLMLDDLVQPITMRYYAIDDGKDSFDAGRQRTLLLRVVGEAVERAGLNRSELASLPVFVGSSCFSVSSSESHQRAMIRDEARDPLSMQFVGYQQIATTIREGLDVGAQSYAFNTACTASANALMAAARAMQVGRCRHALVVGVELANRTTLAGFSGLQLLADVIRPFDRRRRGIVLGEAIGAVLLSTDDGGYPVSLTSASSNSDPSSVTAANPDGSSIAAVQSAALRYAGLEPSHIRGIKSHGTASPMNDTGEAAGISRVFDTAPPICALKPYIGHTLGACGVVELVLMATMLERGTFPATLGFEEPDPRLSVRPRREATEARSGHYLLNCFGFGGNNTSLVIHKN